MSPSDDGTAIIENTLEKVELSERHLQVLELVIEDGPIGIVALSDETGKEMHRIRYSLRILEREDIIEPTSEGAVPTEETSEILSEINARLDDLIDQLEEMKTILQR